MGIDLLDAVKRRWARVRDVWGKTPPPWEPKQFTPLGDRRFVVSKPTGRVVLEVFGGAEAQEALVAAPEDVAWLIQEVDRLRRLVPSKEFVAAVSYAATVMKHELGPRYGDTRETLHEFAARFAELDPEES